MADYQKLYTLLFNRITDALQALENRDGELAAKILTDAQIKAEDIYIEDDNPAAQTVAATAD